MREKRDRHSAQTRHAKLAFALQLGKEVTRVSYFSNATPSVKSLGASTARRQLVVRVFATILNFGEALVGTLLVSETSSKNGASRVVERQTRARPAVIQSLWRDD